MRLRIQERRMSEGLPYEDAFCPSPPWTRNGYELTRSMHLLPRSTFFKSDCPRGYALLSTKWDCCSFAFSWGKCLEDHLSEKKFLAESNPRLSQPKTKRSRGGKIRSQTDYLNSLPDRAHWIELELLFLSFEKGSLSVKKSLTQKHESKDSLSKQLSEMHRKLSRAKEAAYKAQLFYYTSII